MVRRNLMWQRDKGNLGQHEFTVVLAGVGGETAGQGDWNGWKTHLLRVGYKREGRFPPRREVCMVVTHRARLVSPGVRASRADGVARKGSRCFHES